MKGMDFCVVKTKGAKSGRTRYIPLMHVPYKKGVILVASMGGADFHPSWYWNIKAHPGLSVYLRISMRRFYASLDIHWKTLEGDVK